MVRHLELIGADMQRYGVDPTVKEAAFLSNFTQELRSPIHGVMGAAGFLRDTALDAYEVGLIESVVTCSHTLLDTLNLVLDHTKPGARLKGAYPMCSSRCHLP